MAVSNQDTIKICDESVDGERRHQLYVDGCRRAMLTKKYGQVKLNWQVHGPQLWPEAKNLLQGLLELSLLADQLSGEENAKKSNRKG